MVSTKNLRLYYFPCMLSFIIASVIYVRAFYTEELPSKEFLEVIIKDTSAVKENKKNKVEGIFNEKMNNKARELENTKNSNKYNNSEMKPKLPIKVKGITNDEAAKYLERRIRELNEQHNKKARPEQFAVNNLEKDKKIRGLNEQHNKKDSSDPIEAKASRTRIGELNEQQNKKFDPEQFAANDLEKDTKVRELKVGKLPNLNYVQHRNNPIYSENDNTDPIHSKTRIPQTFKEIDIDKDMQNPKEFRNFSTNNNANFDKNTKTHTFNQDFSNAQNDKNFQKPLYNFNSQIISSQTETEKCFVLSAGPSSILEIQNLLSSIESVVIHHLYQKRIFGISFCVSINKSPDLFNLLQSKFDTISIEEDKTYKIGTSEDPKTYKDQTFMNREFRNKDVDDKHSKNEKPVKRKLISIPLYLFRMMNVGNIFFNNYFLDNFVFRFFGINSLIKRFYTFNSPYTGKNVTINIIDTPMCNDHRFITEALLSNEKYSFSKNAKVQFNEAISCGGNINLSSLLTILDSIPAVDILILPFYGPHSEILDSTIKKIGQITTVIASAGDEGEEGCDYSPGGKNVIKVGSCTEHGYVSDFSNKGSCINIYSLGEDIISMNGTSFSATIIASFVATYKEKYPNANRHQILRFLLNNSVKNENKDPIFKINELRTTPEAKTKREFYSSKIVLIFNLILLFLIISIVSGAVFLCKRRRAANADERIFTRSLRRRPEDERS